MNYDKKFKKNHDLHIIMTDYFKFERKEEDIPFYNGKPEISKLSWIVLLAGLLLYLITSRYIIDSITELQFAILSTAVVLIPILYVTRGKISIFFKKITYKDIALILFFALAEFAYSYLIAIILSGNLTPGIAHGDLTNINELIILAIQLIGEELFKITMLILFLTAIYRFIENRKISIVAAGLITLLIFGLCHETGMETIIKVLLIQGLGSVFNLILYVQTKNVTATYASHFIYDLIPDIISLLHF